MLKQPASRNQRCKGFKVTHVLQICALIALCIWLLNQFKNSYDNKGSGIFQTATSEHSHVAIKLGRKDLDQGGHMLRLMKVGKLKKWKRRWRKAEESEDDERGGGDDEIDGHDQEKAEREENGEVEDFIDEEDQYINERNVQHMIDDDDEQRGITEKLGMQS